MEQILSLECIGFEITKIIASAFVINSSVSVQVNYMMINSMIFVQSPEFVFTEEFQMVYLQEHFKAFDKLRQNTSFIGEMIWNFADFMTGQGNQGFRIRFHLLRNCILIETLMRTNLIRNHPYCRE
jgi:hypothetical protein